MGESHDRPNWNRSDDRPINRSDDRAINRSLEKSTLHVNERARRDEDDEEGGSHDRSIWNRSNDLAINRSLKKSTLYVNERARRDEDDEVGESHDRSIWNRSDDRAINRSLKKSTSYLNEKARRDEHEQVGESHDRSIWNRSKDRAINRSDDRAIDRSLRKPVLYLNERAGREEDKLRSISWNPLYGGRLSGLERDDQPKTSTQTKERLPKGGIDRSRPWNIRMYRVHSGSSLYEERSVAPIDEAAPGINTPRSAFATSNAAVSRTETAEARRPSRYRPIREARRGTIEHRSDIGSHPIRSESFNSHNGRMGRRSSEDPTGRETRFDRPQQLVPEVGFGIEDRVYGYSDYDTYYSGHYVDNDDSRHLDEREPYRRYGGWDADERTVYHRIEQSFPNRGRYENDKEYFFLDDGMNVCDREYTRYRSPSRERPRTFRAGPSLEPDPSSRTFSGRFRKGTRPLSRSPEYVAPLRHSTMKLEKYDGTTSLDSFLAKYDVCASHNRWSNRECLAQLKWLLTGQAAQILWDMGSNDISNSLDLVTALKARYGTANQCALYRTQLRYRRRGKNETLCELVQDIRRLVVLAYPGPMTETTESIAIDAFIEALGNVDLSLKVREREPSNLDSAYKIAMGLEAFVQKSATNEKERRLPTVRVAKEELDDGPNWKDFLKQFTDLQNERWSAMVKDLNKMMESKRNLSEQTYAEHGKTFQPYAQDTQRGHSTKKLLQEKSRWRPGCFHCGQEGHFKRECPQWKEAVGNCGPKRIKIITIVQRSLASRKRTNQVIHLELPIVI